MNSTVTGILTKEEFFAKFRLALSYYDHYVMYSTFVRSKDFCAQRALKVSGLTTDTKPTLLVLALMRAWNEPLGADRVSETMKLAWKQYCGVAHPE